MPGRGYRRCAPEIDLRSLLVSDAARGNISMRHPLRGSKRQW
jgi:hypothetical protein